MYEELFKDYKARVRGKIENFLLVQLFFLGVGGFALLSLMLVGLGIHTVVFGDFLLLIIGLVMGLTFMAAYAEKILLSTTLMKPPEKEKERGVDLAGKLG